MLTFFSFFFFFFLPCLSCPEYQKQALLQFKSSILAISPSFNCSDDSDLLQSWNSSSSCCEWFEVECRGIPRVVIALYLTNLFTGLSPQPQVETTILAPLFHIRSLKNLSISDNNIQGEIPGVGFANLSNLVLLDMSGNNFKGSIPPQLVRLPYLRELYLDDSSLTGKLLPDDEETEKYVISSTSKLQELSLSGNKFSDGMLLSILCLKGLEFLDLSYNDLSMEIPTEIGNYLPNISTLVLSNNRLTGGIPSSMRRLSKLELLLLHNNLLTGEIPTWLFNFKGLTALYVGGNRLIWNNSVTVEIAPNPSLNRLHLKSCGLVGEIPKWISNQTGLRFLDLSKNNLRGELPEWFVEMRFEGLILSDNEFTGSLSPRLFSGLSPGLLALSRNNFSGELPKNIGFSTVLWVLLLKENNFSGPIPQSLVQCLALQLLDLSRNRFSGNFPDFNADRGPAYIDFSFNDFSGEVPTTFPVGTRFLALGGNKLSGGLPFNLTNLSNLERLELQDNNLTGELPNFLSRISTLQVLNLRNNSFQGSIPQSIFNLRSLRILDVSNNSLTGEIPQESHSLVGMIETPNLPSSIIEMHYLAYSEEWIGLLEAQVRLNYRDLVVNWKKSKQGISTDNLNIYTLLDLSNNQLFGQIPTSLGALKALKLPSSFGDLENIESLDLSHNKLSGSIPPTLIKLQQLTILDVSNNELMGPIPDGGQMGTMVLDPNYFANNSGLCGIQIRVPCPKEQLTPPVKIEEDDHKEPWLLWESVWIGYPIGLLLAIGIMLGIGYFTLPSPSNRRHPSQRSIR